MRGCREGSCVGFKNRKMKKKGLLTVYRIHEHGWVCDIAGGVGTRTMYIRLYRLLEGHYY